MSYKYYNSNSKSLNQKGKELAIFKHHTSAITTVEWSPDDSSVFASGGDDDQIAIWDLAVERDTTNDQDDIKVQNLN